MLETAETTGTKLILVVEDNEVDRILFEDSLRAVYRLDTAADSEGAVSRLDSQPAVDLLLLDLKLPRRFGQEDTKEEGYRVIQHLRQQTGRKSPEIVVVSAYLTPEDQPRLKELGIRYVLPKRVTDEQLYAAVADALRPAA
jgi:CheY-like chemotaxis protein